MRSTAFALLVAFTLTSAASGTVPEGDGPSSSALRQVGLEEGKKAALVTALNPDPQQRQRAALQSDLRTLIGTFRFGETRSLQQIVQECRGDIKDLTPEAVRSLVDGVSDGFDKPLTERQTRLLRAARYALSQHYIADPQRSNNDLKEWLQSGIRLFEEHRALKSRWPRVQVEDAAYLTMIRALRRLLGVPAAGLEETRAGRAAGAAAEWPALLQTIADQREDILREAGARGRFEVYVEPSLVARAGPDRVMEAIQRVAETELQVANWLDLPLASVNVWVAHPLTDSNGALQIVRETASAPPGWVMAVRNLPVDQPLPDDAIAPLIVQAFLTPGQAQTVDATPFLAGLEEVRRRALTEIFT